MLHFFCNFCTRHCMDAWCTGKHRPKFLSKLSGVLFFHFLGNDAESTYIGPLHIICAYSFSILNIYVYIDASHGDRKTLTYRIICGCILLTAVVLPIIYIDVYTSQLTVPHYQPLVKSIEDVAANPNIKSYLMKGFATAAYIMVRKSLKFSFFFFFSFFKGCKEIIIGLILKNDF